MIRLHEVSKTYRTDKVETLALKDIDLHVARGEFVAMMGPSGCGKSTLLNLIGLLDRPGRGTVEIDGVSVARHATANSRGCATAPSASSSRAST